jgi:hypothetical protein
MILHGLFWLMLFLTSGRNGQAAAYGPLNAKQGQVPLIAGSPTYYRIPLHIYGMKAPQIVRFKETHFVVIGKFSNAIDSLQTLRDTVFMERPIGNDIHYVAPDMGVRRYSRNGKFGNMVFNDFPVFRYCCLVSSDHTVVARSPSSIIAYWNYYKSLVIDRHFADVQVSRVGARQLVSEVSKQASEKYHQKVGELLCGYTDQHFVAPIYEAIYTSFRIILLVVAVVLAALSQTSLSERRGDLAVLAALGCWTLIWLAFGLGHE